MAVDIGSEPLEIDRGRPSEELDERLSGDELPTLVRAQFTDRPAVPRHDEVLAVVERPHHLAAVVA
ncbi:MAG TPA: hypothetical protein VG816_03335 [Solirubrobacterales bacterium]|nr:hypothetical protein [Solirubrobacterales bacterium]